MDSVNLLAEAKKQILARLEEFLKNNPRPTSYSSHEIYNKIETIKLEHDGIQVEIGFTIPKSKG